MQADMRVAGAGVPAEPFSPPRFLRNPHLQSMLASSALRCRVVLRATRELRAAAEDLVLDCGDGVRLLSHHSNPSHRGLRRTAVIIHGWEGSSNSSYVLCAAAALYQSGYRVVRLNLRDHGDSHHLNPEIFHSCRLAEVVGAIRSIGQRFAGERLYLGGYSLGGNFALRVAALADEADLQLGGVAAVCPVLDPEQTMHALDNGLLIYRLHFLRKWRRSLQRKKQVFPELYSFSGLERFRTLESMTDYFVRHYTEFPDLTSYLRGYALTGARLAGMRVPARMLLADDDPVIPIAGLADIARTDSLEVQRSARGGHCGFVQGLAPGGWLDRYLVAAFEAFPDRRVGAV